MNQPNIRGRILLTLDYNEFVTYSKQFRGKYRVKARETPLTEAYQRMICSFCVVKPCNLWEICGKIIMQLNEEELEKLIVGDKVELESFIERVNKVLQELVDIGILSKKL